MKLRQIKIINFGRLSNVQFDLAENNLDVFFGKNEAGKSTTVAFIKQILFGFYLRNNSSPFFEDYVPLAQVSPMGGSLVFSDDGHYYELTRLWAKGDKTKKGTLTVKRDGQMVPESEFFDKIHQIDGNFYADSFIFNQEMLAQILSLNQKDLLERIYYLGAENSSELLKIRTEFAKEANNLFKRTGKKPEVNQLLTKLDEKRQILENAEAEFKDYQELKSQFDELKHGSEKAQKQVENIQQALNGQLKLQESLDNYHKLQDLRGKVKQIDFDPENYQKAQNVAAQIKNIEAQLNNLQKQEVGKFDDNFIQQAEKILQQKAEFLQWDAQRQTLEQKNAQIKLNQKQTLQLNPTLKYLLPLTDVEITQLKTEAALLEKQAQVPEKNPNPNSNLVSIVLILVGIICLFVNLPLAIGLLATEIIYQVYLKYNQKQDLKLAQKVNRQSQAFKIKYGFDAKDFDAASVISCLTSYRMLENELTNNQNQLQKVGKQLTNFTEALSHLLNQDLAADFDSVKSCLNDLQVKLEEESQAKQTSAQIKKTLASYQKQLTELKLDLKELLLKAQVTQIEDYAAKYTEYLRQSELKTQLSVLEDSLKANLAELKQTDSEQIANKISSYQAELAETKKTLAQYQNQLAIKEVKLSDLADSNAVFNAKQDLANAENEFLKASQEYLANLFAARWINRALDLASNERFPKMLVSAKKYYQLLTGNRYQDIILDKKIKVVNRYGKKIEVKYLSRATAEQLYFALKLAFVEQIRDQIELPILIDDSFVNFDDDRLDLIKELLDQLSQKQQVLIFTAQEKIVNELNTKTLTFEGN